MLTMLQDAAIWVQFLALILMLYLLSRHLSGPRLVWSGVCYILFLIALGWAFSRESLVVSGPVKQMSWRDLLTLALASITIMGCLHAKWFGHPIAAASLAIPASLCVADHLELMVLALLVTLGARAFGNRASTHPKPALRGPVLAAAGLGLALHVFGIPAPRIALGWLLAAALIASLLHTLFRKPRHSGHRSAPDEKSGSS